MGINAPIGVFAVSYTHLDVYKRQELRGALGYTINNDMEGGAG